MDIISLHKEDDTGKNAEKYIVQLIGFLTEHKYTIVPSWESTIFNPLEIGPELAIAGIIGRTFFVNEINGIMHTLTEFFTNGTLDFVPPVGRITFKSHADATDVILDDLIICSFVNTAHENLSSIMEKFPLIIELNKILLDYMAPEIISAGSGDIFKIPLMELTKKIRTKMARMDKPAPPHKSLKLFDGSNEIFPVGLWPLKRHYPINDANTIYLYFSIMSLQETVKLVKKRWPSSDIHYSAFKIHSGHIGHKLSVNTNKDKMTLEIVVGGHQVTVPVLENGEVTSLFNLFMASCLFFTSKYYEKAQRSAGIYNAIIDVASDIILRHINDPQKITLPGGPVGALRYIHHTRQIKSIVWNSNSEQYSGNKRGNDSMFDEIELDVDYKDDAFVMPIYVERQYSIPTGKKEHGGKFTTEDLINRFDIVP